MISVIIPAHNEERYIGTCLRSIKNQSFRDFEIIVTASACGDKTVKIARKYAKVVVDKRTGVSLARNIAVRKAKGDILVFIDADSAMSRNLLKEVNRAVRQGYVGGISKTYGDKRNFKTALTWSLGNFFNLFYKLPHGFFFCKRKDFKPFREDLKIGEDTLFMKNISKKGRIKYIRNAYIRTSMRRFEKEGYLKTVFGVVFGYFFRKNQKYRAVR